MSALSRCIALLMLLSLSALAVPLNADAYLDPGTGSALVQVLVAAVMGAVFVAKSYWQKIVGIFKSESVDPSMRESPDGLEDGGPNDGPR